MKLWEIKANALKLMFADSDVQFSKEEFENGSLKSNGNTRDKLVRMNDSIRRAIDLYYQYTGQHMRKARVKFLEDTNKLDTTLVEDLGFPVKIELARNNNLGVLGKDSLDFYYDNIGKTIEVEFDYSVINNNDLEFILHYIVDNKNLPDDESIDDLTFDLDDIFIPRDIQRMIPLHIKGELYEEDEYAIAMNSKNEFLQYLVTNKRKYSNVQTKVKSIFKRG